MSAMALSLKSLEESTEALQIRWTLDCPARGVVILDAAVGEDASGAPLHWRAGDWKKPPLDIRLSEGGAVESIQFVFQDEVVGAGRDAQPLRTEIGTPIFDVAEWPIERYVDDRVAVTTRRLPSGELYAAIGDDRAERSISVTWGLRFHFSSSDHLVGIVVGPLTADEWQLVDAAAPPDR